MYQRLSIHSAGVCCGYIENVEFARRPTGTPGVRHPVLERALYMQLPDPCSAEAFAVSHNARMAGDPVYASGMKKSKDAAVLHWVKAREKLPPTMIAHGTANALIPPEQSRLLYDALIQAGQAADLYLVEGAAHADPVFFQQQMTDLYAAFIRNTTQG